MKHTLTAFAAMVVLGSVALGQDFKYPYCAFTEPDTITFMGKRPALTKPAFFSNLPRGGHAIPSQTWDRELRVIIIYAIVFSRRSAGNRIARYIG